MEAWLEDLRANLVGREGSQVRCAVPRRQVVIDGVAVLHHDRRLRQFHVEAGAKNRRAVPWDGDERDLSVFSAWAIEK